MDKFGGLNWLIISIYLLANLLLGFVLSKKVTTAEDFYIGKRIHNKRIYNELKSNYISIYGKKKYDKVKNQLQFYRKW